MAALGTLKKQRPTSSSWDRYRCFERTFGIALARALRPAGKQRSPRHGLQRCRPPLYSCSPPACLHAPRGL